MGTISDRRRGTKLSQAAFALGIVLSNSAFGQGRTTPSPFDQSDLYRRMASSEFIFEGTLFRRQGVGEQPAEREKRIQKGTDTRLLKVGVLYTLSVTRPLCDWRNFQPRETVTAAALIIKDTVAIFVPAEKVLPHEGNPVEAFLPDVTYLLLLVSDEESERMKAAYELSPDIKLYRAVEGDRGAIPLSGADLTEKARDLATSLRHSVGDLCEAVQPSNALQKLDRLQLLRFSSDPVMRQNAEAAIELLGASR